MRARKVCFASGTTAAAAVARASSRPVRRAVITVESEDAFRQFLATEAATLK